MLKLRGKIRTVALLGADGAGKTSVAKRLLEAQHLSLKYLYMGVNVESSNVALPTSRLAHLFKVYQHKRSLRRTAQPLPEKITLHGAEHRTDRRGKIVAVLRLFRRVSEEMYRQVVSWMYQWRGHIVLYDRHFLFDACPPPNDKRKRRLTERIHHLFLRRFYPRPGLVIFLDAPPEVLYERKREVPIAHLRSYRQKLFERRVYAKNFIVVDATRSFEEVLASVTEIIARYCLEGGRQHASAPDASSNAS